MSYTPPAGDAANFSWEGVAPYTPPAGDAADFSWPPTEVIGVGAGTLEFTGAGVAEHTGEEVVGEGAGTLSFTGSGAVSHGVAGAGAGPLSFTGSGAAVHGIAGTGSGTLDFSGSGVGVHPRYELRGEVRLSGVLVNRRVRAYLRSTGAMVGEAETTAGRFAIHTGFAPAEHTVTPIDLSDDATDWLPPTANRVMSVLAEDVP